VGVPEVKRAVISAIDLKKGSDDSGITADSRPAKAKFDFEGDFYDASSPGSTINIKRKMEFAVITGFDDLGKPYRLVGEVGKDGRLRVEFSTKGNMKVGTWDDPEGKFIQWDDGTKWNAKHYHLLVEGCGLLEVMGRPGVRGLEATTNHVLEMEKVLGIEAARQSIIAELRKTMNAYSLNVDSRHYSILADVMTYTGKVLGITRGGMEKMDKSVLMLASFENTTQHIFNAATHGYRDAISGVSECIIMGRPIPCGTGLFTLTSKLPAREKCMSAKEDMMPPLIDQFVGKLYH